MNNHTKIIYLTAKPGVGKYTIAKLLAKQHGFILCDNQLINNPIFELLQYDGHGIIPDFAWDSIGKIRTEIFEFLRKTPDKSYIFTNNLYDDEGDKHLYEQILNMAQARSSLFVPIRFTLSQAEHLKRITNPTRRERWKSIDIHGVYDTTPLLPIHHPNLLELELSDLTAKEAANQISNHINILCKPQI